MVGATLYHALQTHFHISSFKHGICLLISFFVIIFQAFSMEFISL